MLARYPVMQVVHAVEEVRNAGSIWEHGFKRREAIEAMWGKPLRLDLGGTRCTQVDYIESLLGARRVGDAD